MRLTFTTSLCIFCLVHVGPALTQDGGFSPAEMARKALQEPFVGVTTDGTPEPDLFVIKPPRPSMEPVRKAARAFLESLSERQRSETVFPIDSEQWRHWSNFHQFPGRAGVMIEEMTDTQRQAAYDLLRASLSAKGYETSRDIMRLNSHLAELVNNFEQYGEHKYWVTMFSDPSSDEPWGWQFEGHHLVINYFLLGDQLVMTPTFMGSEPVRAESGKYAGTEVLQDVQDAGLAFMMSLSESQREEAIIGRKQGRSSALGELFKDNIVVPYEGLAANRLSEASRRVLIDLITLYVENLPPGHAELKMNEVLEHIDETHFAWRGGTDADSVYYYRIQSPVIFIEFDHQGPIALEGSEPTRNHVHTVVRTPNGNDYGRDLLKQHYQAMETDAGHGHVQRP
ncbi:MULTISPECIES: DUF3500 domain-containing protein [unclassified Sinorhizobium]|uniref:DUF3500 domain-containing protein n=1 Tax=unclassified Sinorhizobium TaxID=2613772 RepID=UPI003525B6D8